MSTATFVMIEDLREQVAALKAERDRYRDELGMTATKLKSAERLLEMECGDVNRILVALDLCEAAEVDERFRTEGGFIRVGRVVEAIKATRTSQSRGER